MYVVPWDKVDEEYVEKPKKWEPKSIGNFMRWFGPTSSIFDIVTYLFMYFIVCPAILGGSFFELNGADQLLFIGIFHAGWFIESLWSKCSSCISYEQKKCLSFKVVLLEL